MFVESDIPIFDAKSGEKLDYHETIVAESEKEIFFGADDSLLEIVIDKENTEKIRTKNLNNQVIAKEICAGDTNYSYYFELNSIPYFVTTTVYFPSVRR